jgi:transposase
MGSTRRGFTDEYRADAVSLVTDGGRSVAEVAKNIGCHEMTLRRWVQKMRADQEAEVSEPLPESERAELVRAREELRVVRGENSHLKMQVEFAKKVVAWVAKTPL